MCTNIAIITSRSQHQVETISKKIDNVFTCYYKEYDEGMAEIGFDSKDVFPLVEMESITKNVKSEDLYIQVVSYELQSEYVGHHIFKDLIWIDKLSKINDAGYEKS